MDPATGPVVIVGAGQAGGRLALTLRDLAPHLPITLIGAETRPPYERPPLSKEVLSGTAEPEVGALKPATYYTEAGIELRTGCPVLSIDRESRRLALAGGEMLDYGTLVLATGARARRPAWPGANNVLCLRDADDALALRTRLRPGARIVVIGAGYIGLETASLARIAGCAVTVIEAAPRALARSLPEDVAEVLVARHRAEGVDVRFSATVKGVRADGDAFAVELADGTTVPADTVLAGIGAAPCTDLAETAGLEIDNGIVTDAAGVTSDPAIRAIGDVACSQHPLFGRRIRTESWHAAQSQATRVAHALAGQPLPPVEVPWFWTHQYDMLLQMIGLPAVNDQLVWRGAACDQRFTLVAHDGGRVTGGWCLNQPRDLRLLGRLVLGGKAIPEDSLADPGQRLDRILKETA